MKGRIAISTALVARGVGEREILTLAFRPSMSILSVALSFRNSSISLVLDSANARRSSSSIDPAWATAADSALLLFSREVDEDADGGGGLARGELP